MTSPSPANLVVIWKADCVAIQGTVQSLKTHRTPPEISKKKHLQTMCIFNFVSKCFKTISTRWIPKIAEAAGKLRVGPGNASETDVGPLISKQVGEDGRKMGGFYGFLWFLVTKSRFWVLMISGDFWWVREFRSCELGVFSKDHRLYLSSRPSPFTVMALVWSCKGNLCCFMLFRCAGQTTRRTVEPCLNGMVWVP